MTLTTLVLFGVAGVLLLFVRRTLRVSNPILDFKLFRIKVFSTSSIALFFMGAAFLSIIVFLPLFMVQVVGVSATKAGISLIPLSMGIVSGSVIAGQVVSRFGHYRRQLLGGGLLLMMGVFLLSQMTADVSYLRVMLYMTICGLGFGPSFPLYTLAIQNAVELSHLGQATSASQFFRQIGGVVGVALMGTVFAVGVAASVQVSDPEAVRIIFAETISGLYGYTLACVVLAWVATLFVPELPLRKTIATAARPVTK